MAQNDPHLLSAQLVDALDADATLSQLEALLAKGADPLTRPYRDRSRQGLENQVADCPLDHALLHGKVQAAELFFAHGAALDAAAAARALGLAALGRSDGALACVIEHADAHIDSSSAFAYALNQGFTSGALRLLDYGAASDASAWINRSCDFQNYKVRYTMMRGRFQYGIEDDFFAYFFRVPMLEAMLYARGLPMAGEQERHATVRELARAGFSNKVIFRECALRAYLFDLCDDIAFFCDVGGLEPSEPFSNQPPKAREYWVYPDMSPQKVEFTARIMPEGYRFPLTLPYLSHPQTLRAIVPHAAREKCTCPVQLAECLAKNGFTEELALTADWGGITSESIDGLIELAHDNRRTQTVAWLMGYKREHFGGGALGDLLAGADLL